MVAQGLFLMGVCFPRLLGSQSRLKNWRVILLVVYLSFGLRPTAQLPSLNSGAGKEFSRGVEVKSENGTLIFIRIPIKTLQCNLVVLPVLYRHVNTLIILNFPAGVFPLVSKHLPHFVGLALVYSCCICVFRERPGSAGPLLHLLVSHH